MPTNQSHRCRLYLITPPSVADIETFATQAAQALEGGDVACLQIRLKDAKGSPPTDDAIRALAQRLIPPCQQNDVAVLINDRPDLAASLGADGVHVGQGDAPYAEARQRVGPDAIVGVTCRNSRHLAMQAGEAGADYVAFGAFYPTQTKDVVHRAEPELLEWWQQTMEIPCVAIGGITVNNAEPLVRAGADFLAVSGGVWAYPDGPRAAVQMFNEIFDRAAAAAGD